MSLWSYKIRKLRVLNACEVLQVELELFRCFTLFNLCFMFSSLRRIPTTSKHGLRQLSTATIIPAVASRRQLALPIAFLSVKGWGPPVHE